MLSYALAVICACLLLTIWRKYSQKMAKGPPVMPGAWPIVGHLPLLAGSSVHFANFMKQVSLDSLKYGGIVTLHFGLTTFYAITDPDDCEMVLNTCLEKHYLYDVAIPWLGDGLVIARLAAWRHKRKLLSPAFGQQVLNSFIDEFNYYGKKLVEDLSMKAERGPFDPEPIVKLNSLQSICKTALGMNSDENPSIFKEYMVALTKMLDGFYKRWRNIFYHSDVIYNWSSLKKTQDDLIRTLHNVSNTIHKKRKEDMQLSYSKGDKGGKYKPFMDHALKLSLENNVLTDTEVREQTDNVISAGYDTTAGTNLFTLVLVGSYPDVQERVYNELYEVLGNRQDVGKDDIPKLVYLEAVIKESIRLFPVAPAIARKVDTELKLKHYTIPAGTSFMIMLWGLHFHPSWGSDVHEFRPERWLDPGSLPENPNTFAGFSIGRRACIGKAHAMMTMKVTLAHLLRRYRVTADVTKLTVKMDTMMKPASGHEISLEKRL